MANVFQTTPIRKIRRNRFDLSHDVKYTTQFGKLIPVLVQETLPGDSFRISTETLIRFAPMVAPVMHNIKCFVHYFFVPNRIVFPDWEKFISSDLSDEVPPAWPYVTYQSFTGSSVTTGSLADYLGLPVGHYTSLGNPVVSAIPFAAYQCIYNEYYRDQNLVPEVDYKLTPGAQGGSKFRDNLEILRTRAWMHDYFTSALPFQQKGPQVNLPIGDYAPIYSDKMPGDIAIQGLSEYYKIPDDGPATPDGAGDYHLWADLSNATASTIADLRIAFRLQEWFEKAARGGSRYVEQLKVHFNVNSSDKRMQRPEFLGGTRTPVVISEVLQTSSSDATTPQANMAGHGIAGQYGSNIRYFAEEHGYIIGIMSVMPNTAYQQGIPRHFSRQSWDDYAWPTFAHLSEQAILNKELYVANDGQNENTFGFVPRYSEYRYSPSRIAGEFRSTLDEWHLGRIFANRPQLNQQFIECNPSNRIFAVSEANNQNLWCHSYHKIRVKRALPKYGVPTL